MAKRYPPKPPLAFRAGVVGHRPDRLKKADLQRLSGVIHEILASVKGEVERFSGQNKTLFADVPPVLRAVSPLAEGSDRIFADEALSLGYELCCPMPFPRAEYEKDFTDPKCLEPDSLKRFNSIIERAKLKQMTDTGMENESFVSFELPGDRSNEGDAYGACGNLVLNQSDILIVIWDGGYLGKPGGTEQTFDAALKKGIPVVWIDACAPHNWQVIPASGTNVELNAGKRNVPASEDAFPELGKSINDSLALPAVPGIKPHQPGVVQISDYYSESKPGLTFAFLWRLFRDLFGSNKISVPKVTVGDFEKSVLQEWPENDTSPVEKIIDRLRPFYAWPDKLAVYYSDIYRSAFILVYLLAAFAVGMALLPLAMGWIYNNNTIGENWSIFIELLMILLVFAVLMRGRVRHWHEKWIDYRLAAELIRHLRLVMPFGKGLPFPQIPAYNTSHGHPAMTWMSWYVRAVNRAVGLQTTVVDRKQLSACLDHLSGILVIQASFHEKNEFRYAYIEKKLHRMGLWLMGITIVACFAHLVPKIMLSESCPVWLPWILTAICGFLPALGAAFASINNQSEFLRLSKRSNAMGGQIRNLLVMIESLKTKINSSGGASTQSLFIEVDNLTGESAQLLVGEVLDWRVVFLDRPLPKHA